MSDRMGVTAMAVEGMQGSKTVQINAPADRLWGMVSDVTKMPELSPETFDAEWIDGATGPAAGARFKGRNQRDGKGLKWSTKCTVVGCEPGKEFTFVVGTAEKPITKWSYTFAPSGSGTDVTESWEALRYGAFSKLLAKPSKRTPELNEGVARTLAALKANAESGTA